MIVPFIFTLSTNNKYPHLWVFYKMLDMTKKYGWPIIAQEEYFQKPSFFARMGYKHAFDKNSINNHFIYDIPKDKDLDLIQRYPIYDKDINKLIKEKGSCNDLMKNLFIERNTSFESIIDKIICKIKTDCSELIDAVISLTYYPSLDYILKKHNIRLINFELGTFRGMQYRKTAYFSFGDLYDCNTINKRYIKFIKEIQSQKINILSNIKLLSLILNDNHLSILNSINKTSEYEVGIAAGYAYFGLFYSKSLYNDEELVFNISKKYGDENTLFRLHPGDPARAQYSLYKCDRDKSPSTIEFILKCKRVASLGSNVCIEAAFWGRTPYVIQQCPAWYNSNHDVNDETLSEPDFEYLNFFLLCYLIPYEFLTDVEYIKWRLSEPSEIEIYKKHLSYYLFNSKIPIGLLEVQDNEYINSLFSLKKIEIKSPIISNKKDEKSNTVKIHNELKTQKIFNVSNELQLYKEYQSLVHDYNSIINSKSWKLTKPMRKILDSLRKRK